MFYSITCPYCRFPIQPLEAAVICDHCNRVQHRACWEANAQCASPDCTGEPKEWSSLRASAQEDRGDIGVVPVTGGGAALGSRAALSHRLVAPPGAAREGSTRRQVSVWPAALALAALIIWALYQSFLLAGESGLLSRYDFRVVAAEVGLHMSPSTDSPTVAVLSAGTRIDLVSVGPRWVKIVTGSGRVGFIPRDRLETAKPRPRGPVTGR